MRGFLILALALLGGCRVGFGPPCRADAECDDFNPCTDDLCRPPEGCLYLNNTQSCDDGDPCSTADGCREGMCVGLEYQRDLDSDGHIDAVCGGDDCDDGNPAVHPDAEESLAAGGCDDLVDNDCDGLTDAQDFQCLACLEDSDCDDADACTGDERCQDGACLEGEPPNCDDGLYCTGAESCDPGAGCLPGSPPCPQTECNHCNEDQDNCFDDPGTACGDPADHDCSDPDGCDGAGLCRPNHLPVESACDDGLYCNGTDSCDGSGNCSKHAGAPCLPQDCDEATDTCSVTFPFALGQQSLTDSTPVEPVTAWSLRNPVHLATDGTRMAVADRSNNRILIWDSPPLYMAAPADVVVGQPDFVSRGINVDGFVTERSLYYPFGAAFCQGHLVVADSYNHRVLIFDTVPASNYPAAALVLGQPDMSSNEENAGGPPSAQTFHRPIDVACQSGRLLVVDTWNHRVLIWNSIPNADQQAADVVLGQTDMLTALEDSGGIGPASLDRPHGLYVDADHLMVADHDNSRLLIWNSIPTENFTPADLVIGQPDFISQAANNGGVGDSSLNYIVEATKSGGRLYVADKSNNRVLIWDGFPTANGQPANRVLGQPDFLSNPINGGAADPSGGYNNTQGILVVNGMVYVTEWNNNRALVLFDP